MAIDRIQYPWAENGSLDTTLTDAKRNTGWISGDSPDQPTIERLNLLQNTVETKINDLIDYGPAFHSSDGIPSESFVAQVFSPDTSMMAPFDNSNTLDLGHTGSVYDISPAVIGGAQKIITIEFDSSKNIRVYDVVTRTLETSYPETTLFAALDTSGTQDWNASRICCDADYLYVLFRDDDPSPREFWVQAYNLSDLTRRATWPIYGTQLSAYQQVPDYNLEMHIINATVSTSGKLAIAQPWRTVTSGTSEGIAIIDKSDGTIDGYGTGDCGSVTTGNVKDICSNGEYIFSVISDNSNARVCSMSISSPGATGVFPAFTATVPTIAETVVGGIACCGNRVVVTFHNSSDLWSVYTTGLGLVAHFQTGDSDLIDGLYSVCTDGVNFWARGHRNALGYAEDMEDFVFRLDGTRFCGYAIIGQIYVETYTDGENHVTPYRILDNEGDDTDVGGFVEYKILADGSGIWMPIQPNSGNTRINRLYKSVIR